MSSEWHDKIFSVTENGFEQLALEIFQFQLSANDVYRAYVHALGKTGENIDKLESIPFLPIGFFKTDKIKSGEFNPELVFESSGTTQPINSCHYVKDVSIYRESFTKCFEQSYGKVNEWCIIGLLPSYLEKGNSSLVYMVENLVRQSAHPDSGFYLYDLDRLASRLQHLGAAKQKTLLIGVTYALLDFAEKYPMPLDFITIMETGGMKGRRKELTRMEVHDKLKNAFNQEDIHSEYGMTELLSQAYSKKDGLFHCPPWMKVVLRDEEDPLSAAARKLSIDNRQPVTGAINVIDLANVYSCSFIATDDVGRSYPDETFEVLGRMDGSDLRGCSLLTV